MQPRPFLQRALLLAGVAMATGAFSNLHENELECEEALAHADDCCSDILTEDFVCRSEGCGDVEPAFDLRESECIQDLDCDAMRDGGYCERIVARMYDPNATTSTSSSPPPRPAVCP
jgi:hypothetical protein